MSQKTRQRYRNKLILPEIPHDKNIRFYDTNDLVATGYERVVIGDRGPYIEFTDEQINENVLHVPEDEKWRLKQTFHCMAFYYEMRTNTDVMVYKQIREVLYADYKPGMWYISPWDLVSDSFPELIKGNKPKHVK